MGALALWCILSERAAKVQPVMPPPRHVKVRESKRTHQLAIMPTACLCGSLAAASETQQAATKAAAPRCPGIWSEAIGAQCTSDAACCGGEEEAAKDSGCREGQSTGNTRAGVIPAQAGAALLDAAPLRGALEHNAAPAVSCWQARESSEKETACRGCSSTADGGVWKPTRKQPKDSYLLQDKDTWPSHAHCCDTAPSRQPAEVSGAFGNTCKSIIRCVGRHWAGSSPVEFVQNATAGPRHASMRQGACHGHPGQARCGSNPCVAFLHLLLRSRDTVSHITPLLSHTMDMPYGRNLYCLHRLREPFHVCAS